MPKWTCPHTVVPSAASARTSTGARRRACRASRPRLCRYGRTRSRPRAAEFAPGAVAPLRVVASCCTRACVPLQPRMLGSGLVLRVALQHDRSRVHVTRGERSRRPERGRAAAAGAHAARSWESSRAAPAAAFDTRQNFSHACMLLAGAHSDRSRPMAVFAITHGILQRLPTQVRCGTHGCSVGPGVQLSHSLAPTPAHPHAKSSRARPARERAPPQPQLHDDAIGRAPLLATPPSKLPPLSPPLSSAEPAPPRPPAGSLSAREA